MKKIPYFCIHRGLDFKEQRFFKVFKIPLHVNQCIVILRGKNTLARYKSPKLTPDWLSKHAIQITFACSLLEIKYVGVFIINGCNIPNETNIDDVGFMCNGFCS